MAFHDFDARDDETFSEINMTPLVDVMLVLLIIFMVTMPVLSHAVKVNLPRTAAKPPALAPAKVTLSINADGQWFWENRPISDTGMTQKLLQVTGQSGLQVHVHADRDVKYERVAGLLALVQRHGLHQVALAVSP